MPGLVASLRRMLPTLSRREVSAPSSPQQAIRTGLRIAFGDYQGNLLAIVDISGTRWSVVDDTMQNQDAILAKAIRDGQPELISMVDSSDNVLELQGRVTSDRVSVGDTLFHAPGKIKITWKIVRLDEDRLQHLTHQIAQLTSR